MQSSRLIAPLSLLVWLFIPVGTLTAQSLPRGPLGPDPTVAIVNVHVLTMTGPEVLVGQTVLVRGDRILAVGDHASVGVPENATVVEGNGRYLLPGLTDAHVHLTTDMPWAPTRPDFGDAPLYLTHGVTTVVNLRGTEEVLDWRDRVVSGQIAGPTIYTSGEFVNEPRVHSVEDVEEEIRRQDEAGYDLIKFHEVWTPDAGFLTTTGLPRSTYEAMIVASARAGLPLVGHAPVNLGLQALLSNGQALAHLGALSNLYFLPLASHPTWLVVTVAALATSLLIFVASGTGALVRRMQRLDQRTRPAWPSPVVMSGVQVLLGGALFACGGSSFPGGPLFDSLALRLTFTAVATLMVGTTVVFAIRTVRAWSTGGPAMAARAHAAATLCASAALMCAVVVFWTPLAWRSSDLGIDRLAVRLRDAGVSVQTTLVAYDAIGGPGRVRLVEDPTIGLLGPETRNRWQRAAATTGPSGYRYTDFMSEVAARLHAAGVPLVAGTDAMGLALVAPGSSLHRELELLVQAGLTPYEAIQAATVAPASFLGRDRDFGTVTVGRRADLMLVDGNPLEEVGHLRQPQGVMARGRWYSREALNAMVARLAQNP